MELNESSSAEQSQEKGTKGPAKGFVDSWRKIIPEKELEKIRAGKS